MTDGLCFEYSNATTIYAYPQLNCTEGGNIPSTNSTRRDTYLLVEGDWRLDDSRNQSTTNSTSIVHLWDGNLGDRIDPDTFVLPATIVMLAFFYLIYKMFMGVRR